MVRALFLLAFVSLSIRAGEVPDATPAALRPFSPLVGAGWVATFPNGTMRDEQKFEWVYDGKFLRNEHRVRDEKGTVLYEGETMYAWDSLAEQIVWWYWNTTGGYVAGTLTATEDGWLAEGMNHGPNTQTAKVRGVVRAITRESWESVQYFERDGEWVEQWTMVFRPEDVDVPKVTEEKRERIYIVHYTTGPSWSEGKPFGEQEHAREHSANLQRLRQDGSILVGARYGETGMVILTAASENRARAEIDQDPAVRSGIFKYSLSELRPFFGGCVP